MTLVDDSKHGGVHRQGVRPRTAEPGRYQELEVIVKLTERCNLACSYCYYFFGGDESYRHRPPLMSAEIAEEAAKFLAQGVSAMGIPSVKLVFHGGEPLLQKPAAFDAICQSFRRHLEGLAQVRMFVQTNGTILSNNWMDVFVRHQVNVCVSMDGDRAVHDEYRYDKKGRGSFDKIESNLKVLQMRSLESPEHLCLSPSVLLVLRAGVDYRRVFSYLVDDLGIEDVNVLLPDCSHDEGIPDGRAASEYGEILCTLYEAWAERPHVRFREVAELFRHFEVRGWHRPTSARNPVLIIQSDGDLTIDDSFMPARRWRSSMPTSNISDISLQDWFSHPIFQQIETAVDAIPQGCAECEWQKVCRGGALENRFSSEREFDNPSIYCDALKAFYSTAVRHLVKSGYPAEHVCRVLDL